MKKLQFVFMLFLSTLMAACYDADELELRDLKHPEQDTIRYNLYSNIYSEDTTLQPISIRNCSESKCNAGETLINVPRDYFHSIMIAQDDRSFFTKQFKNEPQNYWPEVSTTENLMLLMSCTDEVCSSYPSTCNGDKFKCAKKLRGFSQWSYLNLVKVDFLFYQQTSRFYSLGKPRFIWQEEQLIETIEGGYDRYSGTRFVGDQFAGGRTKDDKRNGGVYFPASKSDEFFRVQCLNDAADCEYLFYLPVDNATTKKLYGSSDEKIVVRAKFKNFSDDGYDFRQVNKRMSVIRKKLCEFFPCE